MLLYFEKDSELIEKQQNRGEWLLYYKMDLFDRYFSKGKIIPLQKCVIFSDICICISHLVFLSFFF